MSDGAKPSTDRRRGTDASITIRGKRWRVRHGDPGRANEGTCCHETRTITVRRGPTPASEMGTIAHEAIHAAAPFLTEEAVEDIEYAVTNALNSLGWIPSDD